MSADQAGDEVLLARKRVIIMGAGGRDFHNFNTLFREDPAQEVVAFTATQIPYISGRTYPAELAGPLYPGGIPIHPEAELERLITGLRADRVAFSYSDVSHEYVMHRASLCLSLGADFLLPGSGATMLGSGRPVVSVCAVRTGCGKSIISRNLASLFRGMGLRVSVIRHPMAYCAFIPVQRFSAMEDIDLGVCTIEEREEFEQHVERGVTVYSGVDYERVLREAERESDIILWDGGNNDFPFIRPDLEIVLLDALRPGQETLFYPGEVNLRRGKILIITKVNEATRETVEGMRAGISAVNPSASVLEAPTRLSLSDPSLVRGKRVLVIEDGPTITHGEMPYGAGVSAVRDLASEIIDPRPFAEGSLRDVYTKFPHIGPVLPAMGYSEEQRRDLEETIRRAPADCVVIATPVDLRRVITIEKPSLRVSYDLDLDLTGIADAFVREHGLR